MSAAGKRGDQRDALAEQAVERDINVSADRNDAPFEQRRDAFAADSGFDGQFAGRACTFQGVQAMGRGKELLVEACRIHLPMRQTALLYRRAMATLRIAIGYLCSCIPGKSTAGSGFEARYLSRSNIPGLLSLQRDEFSLRIRS
ncbi:hypothetical protein CBM2588_A210084 [Cupriavidus taiwanensis]|nr:hypothetical protein CBM2588_A210084 [Cupriavidus taiwanensis]